MTRSDANSHVDTGWTSRHGLRRIGRDLCRVGAAISAVMLGVVVASDARALPAGTASSGTPVLNPATGDSGTSFQLIPPTGADCPGTGDAGHRWGTFIVPATQDPGVLTYGASGSPLGGPPIQSLRTSAGLQHRQFAPAIGNNFISQVTVSFAFSGFSTLPAGDYKIGFACTLADATAGVVNTTKFWSAPITITAQTGAGPNGFTYGPTEVVTTTTVADTTTTVADDATTTTVSGETTTTTGPTTTTTLTPAAATVTPSSPTAGGAYQVTFPDCQIGETITFSQPQSTPTSIGDACDGIVAGLRRPLQATAGTASASFSAAPTAPGTYTVTMTGTVSAERTVTFVIAGTAAPTGGSPSGASFGSGTIPSTGTSTWSMIVWGGLFVVLGRMATLLGRKPKVLSGEA